MREQLNRFISLSTMNNVIVAGGDHYNTLWLIRSLGMGGFKVTAVIINPSFHKSFVCKSRYCNESYIVNDIDEMIHQLCQFSFGYKVPVFTNGDAVAIALDESYELLSHKYILHHCNHKQDGIKYWMDKSKMLSLAKKVGFNIPCSLSVDLNSDSLNYTRIPYPCLVKPEVSATSSKNSFRICYNEEQLKFAIREIKGDCTKVLIQEYVKKDYEYLVYGVSIEDDVVLPGGLKKVHTCSDTRNLGMASYTFLSDEMPCQLGNFECIKCFVREMGYYGLFSVEFMIAKNKAYILEINLRNDGTCYFTTMAGVNLPSIWAASALGLDVDMSKTLIRPRTKYTLMSQSLLTSLKECKQAKAFSLCKMDDMMPVYAKMFLGLNNILNKIVYWMCNLLNISSKMGVKTLANDGAIILLNDWRMVA